MQLDDRRSLKADEARLYRDHSDKCQRITSLLENNKREDLETEFHKMKGTGKTYGLAEVSQLGEVVEAICMNSALPLADSILPAVSLLEEIYKARKQDQVFLIEDAHPFQLLKIKLRK